MFLDLKKAYDSVNRARLWQVIMEALPTAQHVTAAIKQLYVDLAAYLKGDPQSNLYKIMIAIGLK